MKNIAECYDLTWSSEAGLHNKQMFFDVSCSEGVAKNGNAKKK